MVSTFDLEEYESVTYTDSIRFDPKTKIMTEEDIDKILETEYNHLNGQAFFDYQKMAPISQSQIEKMKSFSVKIQPSPHSSEEQSSFDRSLTTIREKLADIFPSRHVSFATVLFPSRESAIYSIFEGFPWKNGFTLILNENFNVNLDEAMKFPTALNAQVIQSPNPSQKLNQKFLYCFTYEEDVFEQVETLRKTSDGTRFFLCDATKNGTFELPDLSSVPYDYTLLSLKHICGADVTACLMRLMSADKLVPAFYGGGAVSFSCARKGYHIHFKSHPKRFENGTPSMMPIFSGVTGIDLWQRMHKVCKLGERAQEIIKQLSTKMTPYFDVIPNGKYSVRLVKEDANAEELQCLFAERNVFLGVEGNSLIASVGIASTFADVDLLVEAANQIFA